MLCSVLFSEFCPLGCALPEHKSLLLGTIDSISYALYFLWHKIKSLDIYSPCRKIYKRKTYHDCVFFLRGLVFAIMIILPLLQYLKLVVVGSTLEMYDYASTLSLMKRIINCMHTLLKLIFTILLCNYFQL